MCNNNPAYDRRYTALASKLPKPVSTAVEILASMEYDIRSPSSVRGFSDDAMC